MMNSRLHWMLSWKQRLRWSKGIYQVLGHYGYKLAGGIFRKHSFTCYDQLMNQFPSVLLMLIGMGCGVAHLVDAVIEGNMVGTMAYLLNFSIQLGMQLYGFAFLVGAMTDGDRMEEYSL